MSTLSDRSASEQLRLVDAYARRSRLRDECAYYGYEGVTHLLRQQERHRETLALLAECGIGSFARTKVLDVGCGEGDGLIDFLRWGVPADSLFGIDLRPDAIASARRRLPVADLRVGCGTTLPFADGAFGVVQQSTVFSSILDRGARRAMAAEMIRVLAPEGCIVSYDTRRDHPRNPDVAAVTRADLSELFPRCRIVGRAITLLPHRVHRWPLWCLDLLQPWMRWLGCGQTHLLAGIRPESQPEGGE